MVTSEKKREFLTAWLEAPDAVTLAREYPDCSCENAASTEGGYGPIRDDENLRYFVTSRSDIDLKRRPNKKITSAIFKRAFKKGMSVVRIDQAADDEVLYTADLLYKNQKGNDCDYGGLVGVVDFPAKDVRFKRTDTSVRFCCVIDTPLDHRPSHADVVISREMDTNSEKSVKLLLFNQIGGARAFRPLSSITQPDLTQFLSDYEKSAEDDKSSS